VYRLEIDLVKEVEFWGSKKGWRIPQVLINLKPLHSDFVKIKTFSYDIISSG
jgi:hypothetical protein